MTNVEENIQLQRILDTFCIQASHVLCHLIQALLPLHVQITSSLCSILVLGCFIHVYSIYLMQDSHHPISVWIIGLQLSFPRYDQPFICECLMCEFASILSSSSIHLY